MIPYGHQNINQSDIDAVVDVLKSDFLTQGPVISVFEQNVIDKVGAKHGVAVNSATSALHIACLALGLGHGDWLWTSPNTFVASANCALYCGAQVDFVDIDPDTYNMSADLLEDKLQIAQKLGKLPKIVIPVHFAGQSCEMDKIYLLSQKYGFRIIEDASHAIGAKYKDRYVGCCDYSDITIFSFHPVKIITSGEGGLAVTNDEQLAKVMRQLRTHGITRDCDEMQNAINSPWYYEQIRLGFNYRMTDISAALGNSQLQRLDKFIEKRHELANYYNEMLNSFSVILPFQGKDSYSSWHLYVIQAKDEACREDLFMMLKESNIGVNVHYIPVHLQPYYRKIGFKENDFPVAEDYSKKTITIPLYFDLTKKQQDVVVNSINNYYSTIEATL